MRTILWLSILAAAQPAQAQIFPLTPNQDVIRESGQTDARRQDTLPDIARQYHLGFDEIVAANPGVDIWLPGAGKIIRLPSAHLLPDVPRQGIVVNLPDGRLYYYRTDAKQGCSSRLTPSASAKWTGRLRWG